MTKEEIINCYLPKGYNYENINDTEGFANDMLNMTIRAMEVYADHETAALREQLEDQAKIIKELKNRV